MTTELTPDAVQALNFFRMLNGIWQFELKTSDRAAKRLRSTGQRVNTLIFDGMKLEYQEKFEQQAMQVRGMMGFDASHNRYFIMSIANRLPSFDILVGELQSDKLIFHSAPLAEDEAEILQHIVLHFVNKNEYHYTTFAENQEGEWQPLYQIVYRRHIPRTV